MKISLALVDTYFRTNIHLFVALAHPPIVLLTTQPFKQKLEDVPRFLEVVPPYLHPHLLARHDRQRADVFQVDVDQFANRLAEFLHREVAVFVGVAGDDAVGDVMGLVVAQIEEILLVDIAFAVLADNSDVIVVEGSFVFVLEDFGDKRFAFIFVPKEGKYFIDDVGFKIFIDIPQPLSLDSLLCPRFHFELYFTLLFCFFLPPRPHFSTCPKISHTSCFAHIFEQLTALQGCRRYRVGSVDLLVFLARLIENHFLCERVEVIGVLEIVGVAGEVVVGVGGQEGIVEGVHR